MKLFPGSIGVFVLTALTSSTVYGQTGDNNIWNNTGSTDFNLTKNWSEAAVPNSQNATYIMPGYTSNPSRPNTVALGGRTDVFVTSSSNQTGYNLSVLGDYFGTETHTKTAGTLSITFTGGSTYTLTDALYVTGRDVLNYSGKLVMLAGSDVVPTSTIIIGGTRFSSIGAGTFNLTSGSLDYSQGYSMTVGEETGEGIVVQGSTADNTSSTVTMGQVLTIGLDTTGTYSLTNNSVLQTSAAGGRIGLGIVSDTSSSASGTLNISDSSQLIITSGSNLSLGGADLIEAGGTGIINQNGSGSVVSVQGTTLVNIGASGGLGVYNLSAGTLNATNTSVVIGAGSEATGIMNQSGGLLSTSTTTLFIVGSSGKGTFNLSGGNANLRNGFTVGNLSGSIGVVNQSGGTLFSGKLATIGGIGNGTYNLSGGTAQFSQGILVGGRGTINQTGGTLSVDLGETINLSTAASDYNLNGGTLSVGNNGTVNGISGAGLFNFGGGTLQAATGSTAALQLTQSGTLASGTVSTLDALGADIVLTGTYSGGGGFNITGNNTVRFNGVNTYTGETTVTSGSLVTDIANVISSSSLNTGAAGTFNLTLAAGGVNYGGAMTNSGLFNVNFNTAGDKFVIAGPVNSSGQIALAANGVGGELQVSNGNINSITDNGTASTVTIGSSAGGTGQVNFTGNNTYTGQTTVNSGYALYSTDAFGSAFKGDLVSAGTLGSLTTLGTTVGIPSVSVNGNLTSSGNIIIRTADLGVADLFHIAGTANLSGVITPIVKSGLGGANVSKTYTIVNADGGLTIDGNGQVNDAAGLATNVATVLFNYRLSVSSPNTLDLTVTQASLVPFAQNPNQAAVANILNNSTGAITASLGNLSATDPNTAPFISSALQQLSQPAIQYDRSVAYGNSTFLVQNVNGALANMRAGYTGLDTSAVNVLRPGFNTGMGRSLLAYTSPAFHQSAPNGVNYYPGEASSSPTATAPSALLPASEASGQTISDSPVQNNIPMKTSPNQSLRESKWSGFIGGDVILADMNQSAPGSSNASYTAGDVVGGLGFRATSNFTAGVLFDYNHTDVTTDSFGSKTTVNTFSPGIFATYFKDGFYVNGLFTVGFSDYSHKQNLPAFGTTASASPSGMQFITNLDTGYDFHPAKGWTIGPTLGATWTNFSEDAYQETGAGAANLNIDGQSGNSIRTRLGGHLVYEAIVGNIILRPTMAAMWQHEYADTSSTITGSFADPLTPGTLSLTTPSTGRDSALLSAGLNAELNNSMALYLNYMANVGSDDFFAQSVMAGFKGSF